MSREDLLESISALIEASQFPPILTEQQVADMTGLSVSWLRQQRAINEGPPRLAIGQRLVRYDKEATLRWFRAHEVAR